MPKAVWVGHSCPKRFSLSHDSVWRGRPRPREDGKIAAFTQHDPTLDHPIELGAEFVHGVAPEIWVPARQHILTMTEVNGDLWCSLDSENPKNVLCKLIGDQLIPALYFLCLPCG
jgi:hypothetical protein